MAEPRPRRTLPLWLALILLAASLGAGCAKPVVDPHDDLVWPFPDVVAPAGHEVGLFVLWAGNGSAPAVDGVTWVETRLGQDTLGTYHATAPHTFGALHITRADPDAPRFGVDDHNATRITLMVFNSQARLIATTAPLHGYTHIPYVDNRLTELEDAVYYLGENETAPHGTQRLPPLLEPFTPTIRDLLAGLPVGGAASVIVPEAEYRHAFGGQGIGTLYLTARVDELVHAA
jgi:hypothetical protein